MLDNLRAIRRTGTGSWPPYAFDQSSHGSHLGQRGEKDSNHMMEEWQVHIAEEHVE